MNNKDDALIDIVLNIIRTATLLDRKGSQYAKQAGLYSLQQYKVLAILSLDDHLTMGEIRDNTLVTKQAVTGLIERLKRNELIETSSDKKDRRITRITLTSKGNEVLKAAQPHRIQGNREAFSVLSDEEVNQLSTILDKLIHHIKD